MTLCLESNYPRDSIHQMAEVTNVEDLPSGCLSHGSRRRRRSTQNCRFAWSDIDEFNEERTYPRDEHRVKINSDKFRVHIETIKDPAARRQLYQFAIESFKKPADFDKRMVGTWKAQLQRSMKWVKITHHLSKVGQVSNALSTGAFGKSILLGLINSNINGVAVNLAQFAADRALLKAAEKIEMKGAMLIGKNRFIVGNVLKVASPFIKHLGSVFTISDLIEQVKRFDDGDSDALIRIIGDGVLLGNQTVLRNNPAHATTTFRVIVDVDNAFSITGHKPQSISVLSNGRIAATNTIDLRPFITRSEKKLTFMHDKVDSRHVTMKLFDEDSQALEIKIEAAAVQCTALRVILNHAPVQLDCAASADMKLMSTKYDETLRDYVEWEHFTPVPIVFEDADELITIMRKDVAERTRIVIHRPLESYTFSQFDNSLLITNVIVAANSTNYTLPYTVMFADFYDASEFFYTMSVEFANVRIVLDEHREAIENAVFLADWYMNFEGFE